MARIAPERFEVKRNRVLGLTATLVNDAEIAPAGDETRRDTQGRLVVLGRRTNVVAEHERIGQRCVEICRDAVEGRADRHHRRDREAGLKNRNSVLELAASIELVSSQQQVRNAERVGHRRRESNRSRGHGISATCERRRSPLRQ